MNALEILGDIVEIIVGGITQVAAGIGNGISTLVQDLFFSTTGSGETATTELSTFAIVLCIFAGVSLALGLAYLVFNWLRSFGN